MDCIQKYQNENFTKVEDTIELDNGRGRLTCRQVAFSLPLDSARSLESVLGGEGAGRRGRLVRRNSTPLPEPRAWGAWGRWGAGGSGSDVTVARLRAGCELPGDGPHRPASPSLVNLATLVRRPPRYEDLLVPVSSWEKDKDDELSDVFTLVAEPPPAARTVCSHRDQPRCLCPKDSDVISNPDRKSKFARFLRLYFCPCCICLYEMEQSRARGAIDTAGACPPAGLGPGACPPVGLGPGACPPVGLGADPSPV